MSTVKRADSAGMQLTSQSLGNEYASRLTTQQYGKSAGIDGVRIAPLNAFNDDGGMFAEVGRINESGHLEAIPEFKVRQVSFSLMLPGTIKAFHLHFRQDDVWFVPPQDRLLAGLLDARRESATYNARMRVCLGGGKAQLLYIPRGVAHGAANVGVVPATIFYFVNQQFDINDPDERRLPFDMAGEDFWKITPG